MDPYYASFQEDLIQEGAHFWCCSPEPFDLIASIPDFAAAPPPTTPTAAVAHQSAFTRYLGPPPESSSSSSMSDGGWVNIHRRVIGFLRSIPEAEAEAEGGAGACSGGGGEVSSRGFRHMMRERQRRERLSQSYADLHSMLSSRSKADKNSIVQSAAAYVRELKGVKEELKRHNEVLNPRVARSFSESGQETKIRIRMANPTSTIDSMICALRCLKGMDVKARAIRWEFSGGELTAIMSIETKVGATVVERAVQGAVMGYRR